MNSMLTYICLIFYLLILEKKEKRKYLRNLQKDTYYKSLLLI